MLLPSVNWFNICWLFWLSNFLTVDLLPLDPNSSGRKEPKSLQMVKLTSILLPRDFCKVHQVIMSEVNGKTTFWLWFFVCHVQRFIIMSSINWGSILILYPNYYLITSASQGNSQGLTKVTINRSLYTMTCSFLIFAVINTVSVRRIEYILPIPVLSCWHY